MLALKQSGVAEDVTEALRNDQPIPDAKLAALSTFTRALIDKRGFVEKADADAFLAAGYTEQHILGVILGYSVKILSNYANPLFQPEIDQVFAEHRWQVPGKKAA